MSRVEEAAGSETEWSSLCSLVSCLLTALLGVKGSLLCLPPLREGYSTTTVGSELHGMEVERVYYISRKSSELCDINLFMGCFVGTGSGFAVRAREER